jgi:hypothetical protein
LIPKKHKDILDEVIKENEFDKTLAEDVVTFYWETVRKQLMDMSHTGLDVANLGKFFIKPWKVDQYIEVSKRYIEGYRRTKFRPSGALVERNYVLGMYKILKRVKKALNEEEKRKKQHKKKRKAYEISKALGEQGKDTGGIKKQSVQKRTRRANRGGENVDMQ